MSNLIVIFDYDGVIADSLSYFQDAFLLACRQHDCRQFRTHQDFLSMFDTNMFDGMTARGVPRTQQLAVLETMGRRLDKAGMAYDLFDGMPQALAQSAELAVLYVVTSNMAPVVSSHLSSRGVDCFRGILGSETDRSKSAKIRRLAARHEGARLLYVGDTAGDMHEAAEGGAEPVAVTWGWHSRDRLQECGPSHVVNSPAELAALIARCARSDPRA